MAKFNLIEEPWIPVRKKGEILEVSLGEALLEAHVIERIETFSPLEEAVLHRLLLAVLYRALPPIKDVEDARDLLNKGSFDRKAVENYLERWYKRFYLFHEAEPFMQVPDLCTEKLIPWIELVPERVKGHNPTLFDHTTANRFPAGDYATVARALLVHQSFDLAGRIPGLEPNFSAKSGPLVNKAIFLPIGGTLFETLIFNFVPYPFISDDAPIWEEPPLSAGELARLQCRRKFTGVTRTYTWMSRGVRLLDEGNNVKWLAHGPGVEPLEVGWRDPMVAYRQGAKGEALPLRLTMERSFWRDFAALFPAPDGIWPAVLIHALQVAEEWKTTPILHVLGQVSNKADLLDIRREVYPLPKDLLSPTAEAILERGLELAEKMGSALENVAQQVAQGVLGKQVPKDCRQRFVNSLPLLRLYWGGLDLRFPWFLQALTGPGALDIWRRDLKEAACRAWEETRRFVGTEARHLRALVNGERVFLSALRSIKEVKA